MATWTPAAHITLDGLTYRIEPGALTCPTAPISLSAMTAMPERTRRWTRFGYERMIDCGIFREDERLELLDGALIVKEPQGDPHAAAVDLAVAALRLAFGPGWLVRAHAPLALGVRSRPEPDVSVVRGSPRDYRDAAPTQAALVLEVSHTSLALDRTRKSSIYARASIRS